MPDADAREVLSRDESGLPSGIRDRWRDDLDHYARHYDFTADQRAKAEEALDDAILQADGWFRLTENKNKVDKYLDDLNRVADLENDPEALAYQQELVFKDRRSLDEQRKELVQPIEAWTGALYGAWDEIAGEDKLASVGEYEAPWTPMQWLSAVTVWGLLIAGACLMLGLLTPLAALWCAGFLALVYFSNPPWPWLPDNPVTEGHYRFVDKTLIEMLACLVLASTPSGLWIGLDALLFGWIGRRRAARRTARTEHEALEVA